MDTKTGVSHGSVTYACLLCFRTLEPLWHKKQVSNMKMAYCIFGNGSDTVKMSIEGFKRKMKGHKKFTNKLALTY